MSRVLRTLGLPLVLPVVLVAVWWFASSGSTSVYFPPLEENLRVFADAWLFERFESDVLPSLTRFVTGLFIAVVVGTCIGGALGMSPRVRRDLTPATEFFRAMPIAALVPVAMVVLGPGASMETALIAFGSTWPILLSTTDGVRGVDPATLEMARSYGLSRSAQIRQVILPAALPQIFAGMRIALAIALQTMIIANMLSGTAGLGYFILTAQRTFDVPSMWAGILLLALLGFAINCLFVALEHRVLAWHRGWRAAEQQAS